jgi:hypothetical protein
MKHLEITSPFFFILDEVFSVNTTCFVKTMVNARIVVTPLFQMTFQFPKPFLVVCSLEQMRLIRRAASGIDRKDLIQYKEKNANNRMPFVITYHPALSNLSNIVREHWTTIQKHPQHPERRCYF